jgi:hypothetical protein
MAALLWDCPTMIVTMDSKRRLTVSASLAPAAPGDIFRAQYDVEEGEIVFRRISPPGDWLEVMAGCPVRADEVPKRRRELPKRRAL